MNTKVNGMPQKFISIPTVKTAYQWWRVSDYCENENRDVHYYRNPNVPSVKLCEHCNNKMHDHGYVNTLEGGHIVCPSDWIITGIKGEKYPCKDAIFKASYKPYQEKI